MKNILVTVDFEPATDMLLNTALEYSRAFQAKVWIMHIAAPEPDFVGYEVGPQYIRDFRAEDLRNEHRQLQGYAEKLRKQGVDCDGLLVQGATIDMILEESRKLHVDLIIAGHYEHGFWYQALIGTVSDQIANRSNVPVLLVPLKE